MELTKEQAKEFLEKQEALELEEAEMKKELKIDIENDSLK